MKSLLVSGTYFPPQVGGISHFMAEIAAALGPERVCCLTGVVAGEDRPRQQFGPRVYRRPLAFSKITAAQLAGLAAAMAEIGVRERPRIVQLATAAEGHIGLWLKRSLGLPYVIYGHGNEVLDAIKSEWPKPRLALQGAERVLANSRFTAGLVEQAGVAPDRIRIIHPGCDTDHFRPLPPDLDLKRQLLREHANSRVLLSVGGLVARKGHDTVIRALPHVLRSHPDAVYLIVTSDRRNYGTLDALARELGVRERVVVAYDVPTAELPRVYALSDVFVMPSREQREACDAEGFGIVFLEANACGKAVVGGRSGGISDAIQDGETGLLVDPHDPADTASAIARLLADQTLSDRMGRQGRARVVRELSWRHVAERVQEVLVEAVSHGNRQHPSAVRAKVPASR